MLTKVKSKTMEMMDFEVSLISRAALLYIMSTIRTRKALRVILNISSQQDFPYIRITLKARKALRVILLSVTMFPRNREQL